VFEPRPGVHAQELAMPLARQTETADQVLPHNEAAAAMWNRGGRSYNEISFAISDALAHAAQRLNARAGQDILDVATGTGWTARNAAARGARVIAVDIAADLLSAAEELSAHVRPPISFRLADAENLPFADGSFDGVISTFGVMFAGNQEKAASELGRVCRPGGRLVLATWAPGGAVQEFFAVIGRHSRMPPPPASPLLWGDPDHVRRLLGGDFDLRFENGVSHAYHDDVEDIWECYARGFGPVRQVLQELDPDGMRAFKADVDAFHAHYVEEAGLHVRREYLLVTGRRR
jgi:SAM-dependent methyltransferase